jgi:hypothetical protein
MDRDTGGWDAPYGDAAPGAGHKGLASGRAWAWLGLGFVLAVLLSPGRTPGDKLRRACQMVVWEALAMVLISIVLFGTYGLLAGLLGLS